jgi:hypothetical protein
MPKMANQPTCPHCGGTDVVTGVQLGKQAEAGYVGLSYRTMVVVTGTEPLLADLCRACGTVARLWVARVDRNWVAKQ